MVNDKSINIYHRAFNYYKNICASDSLCKAMLEEMSQVDTQQLNSVISCCFIDNDWIDTIEQNLQYVSNAIAQRRQFIQQNEDIVPIEKAKRVSRASVEHLAHNSKYLTRPQEDNRIIPEKIFIRENDNNYAVYENKFLYLLLSELKKFVEDKYKKICEAYANFKAELYMDKKISTNNRNINFRIQCKEVSCTEDMMIIDETSNPDIGKIKRINQKIDNLLNTELMKEMSHVSPIRPPITRTNILKMDNDFRLSMQLYDFICSYQKAGFTVEKKNISQKDFSQKMNENFAYIMAMCTYLMYRYGANMALPDEDSLEEFDTISEKTKENLVDRTSIPVTLPKVADSGTDSGENKSMLEEKIEELSAELDRTAQQLDFLKAQLLGVRAQYGLLTQVRTIPIRKVLKNWNENVMRL